MTDDAVGQPTPQQSPATPPVRPGALLALQRQQRGLTVEDVAKQLNLAPRQIQAIEAENYAALPGMASVRGFIRSYAKLLRMDAAPLLAGVARETVVLQEPTTLPQGGPNAFAGNRLPHMGKAGFPLKPAIAVGVLAVALAAGYVLHQQGMMPPLPAAVDGTLRELGSASARSPAEDGGKAFEPGAAQEAASAASTKAEPVAPPLAASAEPKAGTPAPAAAAQNPPAAPAATAPVAPVAAMPAAPAAKPPAAPAATAPAAPAAVATAPAAPVAAAPAANNLLVLKMSQDSWVEVMRANHKPLVSRILKAGTTENVEINDPVTLTIGNSDGVEATWRGKPLDLKAAAKNNVFRTNLK